ncbi:MAG: crossover junction endodeoxyribonuclease RuvC [Spirochaetales bacterium]
MKVLGIDPGLASLGWGVISVDGGRSTHVAHGVLTTAAGQPQEARLLYLYNEVQKLIVQFCPEQAGIENLYFVKNISSGLPVAEVRGVVLLAFAQAGLAVGQYNPTQIKLALVGVGQADKRQVQEMVKLLLKLPEIPKPDHAADALAAAICHVNQGPPGGLAALAKLR